MSSCWLGLVCNKLIYSPIFILLQQLSDYEAKVTALESSFAKSQSECADLSSQLGDMESKAGTLSKTKSSLESQLEDMRSELQSETSVRR